MPDSLNKERWKLTEESLDSLLRMLHADARLAAERYERLRDRLTFFFMRHQLALPEDLADVVIDRVAGALFEGRAIPHIEAFALGVARMVLLEERRRLHRESNAFAEVARNGSAAADIIEDEEALARMEAEIAALPGTERQMLLQYHTGDGGLRIAERKRLAATMGVSMGTLRKRVFDLQGALRRRMTGKKAAAEEESRGV